MASDPSPDWQRVPGASRAHLLTGTSPAEHSENEKPPSRIKQLLTKPLVWLLAVVLAGVATFIADQMNKSLDAAVLEATSDPILLYDVHQLEPLYGDMSGYVVPGDHSDLEAVEWNPTFGNAEGGGIPTTAWVEERGGSAAGWGVWEVVLEATRETEITVVDIRPENIDCTDPADGGTLFLFGSQGGQPPMQLGIAIDAPSPEFKVLPEDWHQLTDPDQSLTTYPAYGETTQLSLAPGEQEVVQFSAHAASRSCTWDVVLEYATGGEYQTAVLSPSDEDAFALAALVPTEQYEKVVVPFHLCADHTAHVVSGAEAARILAENAAGTTSVDCT